MNIFKFKINLYFKGFYKRILMDDEVKKKVSLIDELMIEDISSLSINELEENISNLEKIIDKYSKKIEEKKISQDKAESIFK